MSSNTYPTPTDLTLPTSQGPAPYAEIESERWAEVIEAVNTGYGSGAVQLATLAWGDGVLTTSDAHTVPYQHVATVRLPVLSSEHTALALSVYGALSATSAGTYARISLQEPSSSFNRSRTKITSTTAAWYPLSASDYTSTVTITTTGDYYDVELGSYYSASIEAISIWALPLGATATAGWPSTAGDVGVTTDGEYVSLTPGAAVAGQPLSSGLAEQIVRAAGALSARPRMLLCGMGCMTDVTGAALYCTSVPKRALVPVWPSAREQPRQLVYHVRVSNPEATARSIYVQHGVGGLDALTGAARREAAISGVAVESVAAGASSVWISGSVDLTPDPSDRTAGQSALYPALQCVGLYWDDDLQVESYSVWEEES